MSMGRLDEGGPRGECAGLKSLLEEIISNVAGTFGLVLQLSEVMFDIGPKVQIDLITDGVWVPIATALMADAGIKMAIFSPGIASILQSNYVTLNDFLSHLAQRLLISCTMTKKLPQVDLEPTEKLYFSPKISSSKMKHAQERIYGHPKTADFSQRWNLPIYYQLRFGDCCTRVNKAIELTRRTGWTTDVFTRDAEIANSLRSGVGFELSFFLELYDTLLSLWRPDVILRPLTHRFLRGAVQLVGRSVAFIRDGMDGKLEFGGDEASPENTINQNGGMASETNGSSLPLPSRSTYSWGHSAPDVASVAWELAILESTLSHDYVSTICNATTPVEDGEPENSEIQALVAEALTEASSQFRPLVERAWNEIIVKLLTEKCSGPLAAVKGVVATYRMTNRPPPTQASPYVGTILRPLKEFSRDFSLRTADYIGSEWKITILNSVTDRYSLAVEELITTVQRTEVALQNRRARRATSGGISDGDKVKLQLYLDFQAFCRDVQELGIDLSSIGSIAKLRALTEKAQTLQQTAN
jgi:conserved oligomeric Golgi complex subunit 2